MKWLMTMAVAGMIAVAGNNMAEAGPRGGRPSGGIPGARPSIGRQTTNRSTENWSMDRARPSFSGTHYHWTRSYWSDRYGCTLYWNPYSQCWYRWSEKDSSYDTLGGNP
jgi:hypothetical protein